MAERFSICRDFDGLSTTELGADNSCRTGAARLSRSELTFVSHKIARPRGESSHLFSPLASVQLISRDRPDIKQEGNYVTFFPEL